MRALLLVMTIIFTALHVSAQYVGIGTTTPTEQLHTTGSVRFENYSGFGNRLLYVDSNGRLAKPVEPGTTFNNNTSFPIPDNGCAGNSAATSTIGITGMPTAVVNTRIAVRVNISHAYVSDLIIYLITPTNDVLCLAGNRGGSGANYNGTIFTQEATNYISAATNPPFNGRYKPQGYYNTCMSTTAGGFDEINGGFNGGNGTVVPNGTWTLKVFDNKSGVTGTLNNWQISFDGQASFGTSNATGPIAYFNNGSLALSNMTCDPSGNIGINNPNPTFKLDVNGTLRAAATTVTTLQITNGGAAAKKVLTATDAQGHAVWADIPSSNTGFCVQGNTGGSVIVHNGSRKLQFAYNPLTTGTFDDGANVDGTVTYGYVAPSTGVYQFQVSVEFVNVNASQNGNIRLITYKNNTTTGMINFSQPTFTGQPVPRVTGSFMVKLAQGDVLTIACENNCGATLNILTGANTVLSGVKLY